MLSYEGVGNYEIEHDANTRFGLTEWRKDSKIDNRGLQLAALLCA